MKLFLSSFLVLFLEIALIRWMPAYIRLLAYFSNFILLASFLGCGLGCMLVRTRRSLFALFPLIQLIVIVAVDRLRLEVAVPSTTSLYFSSGTSDRVVPVESTLLLPLLFIVVALLFVTVAQRMARELERAAEVRAESSERASTSNRRRRPLHAYTVNLLGSLAGVGAFALMSWREVPPVAWFAVAFATALPFVIERRGAVAMTNVGLLACALALVWKMEGASLWSPYYRIDVVENGSETVVAVNNVFHQSMAPLDQKEYFYQWPYTVFGDTFDDVLVLGAGTGTDVAAALRHGAKHVDAVEIDPIIIRLGADRHPDHPYSDPRVRVVNDDARHFLATSPGRYDLIVFALIDSLTVQSSFSGVRLESYMFTEESFRAVRQHLNPRGAIALYNYFREKWLVDRLANTVARVFDQEPRVHIHQDRAYLAVIMAGPRLDSAVSFPPPPSRVLAYRQPQNSSPPRLLQRDAGVVPATDDWPFLYMRKPGLPRHYTVALGVVLLISGCAVWGVMVTSRAAASAAAMGTSATSPARTRPVASGAAGRSQLSTVDRTTGVSGSQSSPVHNTSLVSGSSRTSQTWHFFLLGAGFMLLETKSIVQFALLWGSTWSSASLAIASVLAMALASATVAARIDIRHRWSIGVPLIGLILLNYWLPVGRVAFDSRLLTSLFYGALVFSPVFFAGLLFSRSFGESSSAAADFGANLLGAMAGGVGEYLSLLAGYRVLLIIVAGCYLGAIIADRR
jgi:spermidine synthase